ncbi:PASTA domain-containing protein [Flavobacterium sp.]|uniref:PASTA domain-containing protein n=1 Tax=Flavobacterium sp. TaxID=239 RepID=UPI002636F716|nr:PASTA domain-containing protein [Flavobacterium sp.]MDD2986220.1 PASTA domain-containing protein [Flavobacterium sp.]
MSLRNYLTSKVFFRQIILATCIVFALAFVFFNMLSYFTKHGQEITVPDLSKMSVEKAEQTLTQLNLDYVLLDTLDYSKEYSAFSIVEQEPKKGAKVKANRKIYLKLNAAGYTFVALPNLIEKTFRQAEPTLKSIGLEVGKVTYKPYLGKDMVLEMIYKGAPVKPGTKIMKTSKIDLVLGDGKIAFDQNELDSLIRQQELKSTHE